MGIIMRTIVCTGDSHTWGQGAPGLEESFSPPVMAGDLRLISFQYDSYVNLLRRMVNQKTGAFAHELDAQRLQLLPGTEKHKLRNGCVVLEETPFYLNTVTSFIRIQFLANESPSQAAIFLDEKLHTKINLHTDNPVNAYQTVSLFCNDCGKHQITIAPRRGTVQLYRIETYAGPAAVLNSGIGSCPTFRFLSDYWENYVQALRPSVVVLEAHTINDWLAGDPLPVYRKRLKNMVETLRASGCEVVMLTVSPILGAQDLPFNPIAYPLYVEESRRVAAECGVALCDANTLMEHRLNGLSQEEARALLFHDNWHVNALGHRIYAEALFDCLVENHLI